MAELLVIKQQRLNRRMVPGDVVTVQPDGWAWGRAERGPEADSLWAVIDVPGAPVSAFAELLEPLTVSGKLLHFRKTHLNLLALGERATLEQIMSARLQKATIPMLG